jgi:hypothetical protein
MRQTLNLLDVSNVSFEPVEQGEQRQNDISEGMERRA